MCECVRKKSALARTLRTWTFQSATSSFSQIIVASGKTWPFGQWDHGKKGLLQAYGELLGVAEERQDQGLPELLSQQKGQRALAVKTETPTVQRLRPLRWLRRWDSSRG